MHRLVSSLLLLAACAPNNATLKNGSYIAFLADGTSLSLSKDEVPLDKYKVSYGVDCRTFDTPEDKKALQLPDALNICKKHWPPTYESWEDEGAFHVVSEDLEPWRGDALITSEGDLEVSFHHHIPGGQDLRFLFSIDPDFAPQHCIQDDKGKTKRVPLDGDWIQNWSDETLGWVRDNASDPTGPYGNSFDVLQPYLDGKLYFLNALSYQYDPISPDTAPPWDLPSAWQAGAAEGKFVEEDVFQRRARYGNPTAYNAIELSGSSSGTSNKITADDLFWCDLEKGQNPAPDGGKTCDTSADCETDTTGTLTGYNTCYKPTTKDGGEAQTGTCQAACGGSAGSWNSMAQIDDTVHQIASDIHSELKLVMTENKADGPVYEYAPLVHSNFWREPDGVPAGLDAWSELHYNYVVFDKGSDLTVGGHAKGAFELVFDAAESTTRVFVKGEFDIPKIRKDHWKMENLENEKLIENGSQLCSAASVADADPAHHQDD